MPLSLNSSGQFGLNLQNASAILDPKWATKANNMVFDQSGRLTSRQGFNQLNASAATGSVAQISEFIPASGSNTVVSATTTKLYSGTSTLTDITGTLTNTAGNWKFVNFNGNIYGLQAGHPLIVWTGTGNFTTVTAATGAVPNGNELLSAFGRLWGSDSSGQILKYSNLLDATNWSNTGSGSFNLTSVWGSGNDSIVALAAFNNLLIVFGSRNILVFQDGSGSKLGMDPINMLVSDTIPGIGCVARDSVQNINGEDVAFLSATGVQSLQRVIIERSNATRNISANVRDNLLTSLVSSNVGTIRSTYNANNAFYTLVFPTAGLTYVFDTRQPLQDGTWKCTTWDHFVPAALFTRADNLTTLAGSSTFLYQYTGYQDSGTSYTSTFESGWLDLGEEVTDRLKIIKRIAIAFAAMASGTITIRWAFDFDDTNWNSAQVTLPSNIVNSQYNISQFGIDQFGGGFKLLNKEVPTYGTGQYIKVAVDFPTNNGTFSLNQMQLYCKIGRLT